MSFPNVADALWGWNTAITFKVKNPTIVNYEIQQTAVVDVEFQGILEPIPAQKLWVKPEGERKWVWWTLWTSQVLDPSCLIEDPDGNLFKVMNRSNWNGSGYNQYELTETVDVG